MLVRAWSGDDSSRASCWSGVTLAAPRATAAAARPFDDPRAVLLPRSRTCAIRRARFVARFPFLVPSAEVLRQLLLDPPTDLGGGALPAVADAKDADGGGGGGSGSGGDARDYHRVDDILGDVLGAGSSRSSPAAKRLPSSPQEKKPGGRSGGPEDDYYDQFCDNAASDDRSESSARSNTEGQTAPIVPVAEASHDVAHQDLVSSTTK